MAGKYTTFVCLWMLGFALGMASIVPDRVAHAGEKDLPPPAGLTVPSRLTPMPAFRLQDVSGTTVQGSDFVGKVVVVRFWATW
jgi:hypothetical protein